MSENKKNKRKRKVLAVSCIFAALIVAGSTFAWFTSKDEVTNRLTATADYGVSLVEDFKPPEDMTPGQEVNKDVSVVNTGAIDAFVRASFTENMNMSRLNSQSLTTTSTIVGTTVYKSTDGTIGSVAMKNATTTSDALTAEQTRLYDLKVFGTKLRPNLDTETPTIVDEYVELDPQEYQDATGAIKANEVTTLMAGGQLVVAESTAVAPDDMAVRSGDDVNGATKLDIIYKVKNCTPTTANNGKLVAYITDGYYEVEKNPDGLYVKKNDTKILDGETYGLDVVTLARDYSGAAQYKPTGTGLYIFKRNDTKYSGFYYDDTDKKFYALTTEDNNKSAYIDGISVTYVDGVVDTLNGVKLRTKETGIDNSKGEWKLEFIKVNAGKEPEDPSTSTVTGGSEDTATHLKATFHVDSDSGVTTKDVIFYVKLADNWSDSWKYVADKSADTDKKDGNSDNGLGYFYYKTLLDSGVTSAQLVDSVKLDSSMGSPNYLDMVYDLKVALDSAQVTKDQYGNETAEAVEATTSNGNTTTWATPALDKGGDGVIDSIAWA